METRKAYILRKLNEARRQLELAQKSRGAGHFILGYNYLCESRAAFAAARGAMLTAPASTRRRWKHSDCINTRKRYARQAKQNGIVGGIIRNGRKVYANI